MSCVSRSGNAASRAQVETVVDSQSDAINYRYFVPVAFDSGSAGNNVSMQVLIIEGIPNSI